MFNPAYYVIGIASILLFIVAVMRVNAESWNEVWVGIQMLLWLILIIGGVIGGIALAVRALG